MALHQTVYLNPHLYAQNSSFTTPIGSLASGLWRPYSP